MTSLAGQWLPQLCLLQLALHCAFKVTVSRRGVVVFEWTAMSGQRVCVSDFEEEARKVLPKAVYDYYRSGADEQKTLADNVAAFNRYSTHIEHQS